MRRLLIALLALSIGVPASAQLFNYEMYVSNGIQEVHQIAAAPDGSLFLADRDGLILKVSAGGALSTYAGVQNAYSFADGPAAQAHFNDPYGVAVDGAGNVYVGDSANSRVRKITPDGMVSTFAGSTFGFADGPAATALFASPQQLAFDSAGNLFVLDYGNYAVRKITPGGIVSTVFGGPNNHGNLAMPSGLAVDSAGNVYVCDMIHFVVWKISGGVASVFAGQYGVQGITDGPPGTARIAQPWSVHFDSGGNLYLSDYNVLRRVGPDGSLMTVAGEGEPHDLPGTGLNPMFVVATSALVTPSAIYIADLNHLWRGLPGALSDQAVIDARLCYPGENRQLDAPPRSATAYQWSFQTKPANSVAALSSDSIPNPTFTPDVSGFYRFALRATSGSAYSLTYVTLAVPCRPPATPVVTTSGQFSCPGQAVTLDAGDGYVSYRWSTNETTRTISVSPSWTQEYAVQGADATSCWSDGTSFTQHVFGEVTTLSPGSVPMCAGASPATVTVSDAAAPSVQHQWYYVGSSQQLVPISGATGGSYVVTGSEAGGTSFSLVCVSTSCNGQTVQSQPSYVTVSSSAPQAPVINVYPAALCPSGAGGSANVDNSQNYATFNWTIVNGVIDGSSTSNFVSFHADSSGQPVQLAVSATDFSGCGATSNTVSIPIRTLPPPTITYYPTALCPSGAGGNASVYNSQNYSIFNWTIAHGVIDGSSTSNFVSFHADSSGQPVQLSVTVADFEGCVATSTTASIPIRTLPPPTITYYPTALCPSGAGGNANVYNSQNYSIFNWTIVHGVIDGSSTSNFVSFHADSSGQPVELTVTVSDFEGCVATSTTASIPIRTLPPPTITYYPTALCPSGAGGNAGVDNSQNYSIFNWTIAHGVIDGSSTSNFVSFHADSSGQPVELTVTVADFEGCVATSTTASIPIRTLPPPTITYYPTALCPSGAGGNAGVDNSQNYSIFNWTIVHGVIDGSSTSNFVSFRADSSGQPVELTVTVSDFEGCVATSTTASIPIRTLPPPTITYYPTALCPNGASGNASVDNSQSYAWFNWTIAHGVIDGSSTSSSVSFRADSSGQPVQLSVEVADFQGCVATSTTASIPIRTLPPPTITYYPTALCPNGASGNASVDNSQSYAWFNWTIAHGVIDGSSTSSSVSFRADSSGQPVQLSVEVADFQGCVATSATASIPIRTLPPPTITFYPTALCPNGASGNASVDNSQSYAWFNWSVVNGVIDGPATGNSVSFHADGSGQPVQLSVEVADFQGCVAVSSTTSIPVNVVATPTITASGPTTFCADHVISLTAPYAVGFTYAWSNGATTRTIYVGTTGSYSVTVTDSNGCSSTSAPVVTTVYPMPVVSGFSAPAAVCSNGSGYTASVTNDPALTYHWTALGGVIRSGQGTNSITFDVDPNTSPTLVSLRVDGTDASGCSASAGADVPVDRPTATVTAAGPTTFCAGGSVTLTSSSATSYAWSNGATTQSIVVVATGSYFVTVTDANGCSSARSDVVSVNVLQPQQATITAYGPTTFCQGGSVQLVTGSGSSYLWSNGATTQSITVSTGGTYSVTVGDLSNSCPSTASVAVTVNPLPATPVITASGPATFCFGGSVTLTAPSAASYTWSNGASTQSINAVASGTYSVTITDANGCSATSAATVVTVNPNPTPAITAGGPTTFCAGGSVTLTASSAASYSWSNGATTQSITVNASGSYSVTVTDTNGCAGTSAATVVTVNPNPTPTITAGGPTTFCAGGSVTLTASSGGSYLWSNGATTQSIVANASGSYSVTVTTNGCSGTSAATVVTVNPNPTPTITAGGPTTFCAGGSVTLTASSGGSYLWSNGATTQSIVASSGGSYSVTVTTNGCSGTSAATVVTVNPNPTPTITAGGPTTFCAGGSVTLTASSGGSYLWSNGATTQSIVASASGSYSVAVTTSGCSGTSAATIVTVNPNPTPTITAGGPTTFCAGGSVTLTASSGGSYVWSNGATTQSIVASASGSYSVTVTTNGCSGTSAATVVAVLPLPTATVSGSASGCPSAPHTIQATLTGSAPWSITWSDGVVQSGITTSTATRSVSPAATTTYTITSLHDANCSGSASGSAVITIYAAPAITQQPANVTVHHGTAFTLAVTATGTGLTYQWYSGTSGSGTPIAGATSSSYSTTQQKNGKYNYWVKVTDTCGRNVNSTTAVVTVS